MEIVQRAKGCKLELRPFVSCQWILSFSRSSTVTKAFRCFNIIHYEEVGRKRVCRSHNNPCSTVAYLPIIIFNSKAIDVWLHRENDSDRISVNIVLFKINILILISPRKYYNFYSVNSNNTRNHLEKNPHCKDFHKMYVNKHKTKSANG